MAFDGKSLDVSAMVDKESSYLRTETRYLFTLDEEQDYIKPFNNRTFRHFKDQASVFLTARYFNPKNSMFQYLRVRGDNILHVNR